MEVQFDYMVPITNEGEVVFEIEAEVTVDDGVITAINPWSYDREKKKPVTGKPLVGFLFNNGRDNISTQQKFLDRVREEEFISYAGAKENALVDAREERQGRP